MSDYAKLMEALRCCSEDKCGQCNYNWNPNREFCMNSMCKDAAAAIEALQAEVKRLEPKRGEWKATEMYMTDECTACGFLMNWEDVPAYLFNLPHFKDRCPNCGAKMSEVQDADK